MPTAGRRTPRMGRRMWTPTPGRTPIPGRRTWTPTPGRRKITLGRTCTFTLGSRTHDNFKEEQGNPEDHNLKEE